LVSLGFLLSTLYFTIAIIRLLNATHWTYALYTMAVPMVYLVGGLALTEMPAMFFFSMGLFFIVKSTQQKITSTYVNTLVYAIIGSFFVSISILGRQPYLVVALALPILYLSKKLSFKDCFNLLSAILFVVTIPFCLFYTWKGLMPPSDAPFYSDITGLGPNYRIDYFILCVFYFAVSMFLIAPNFYSYPKKNKVLMFTGTCLLIIIINQICNFLSYIPFLSTTEKIIPSNLNKQLVANLSGSSIILFALHFLVNCFMHIAKQQLSKEFSFFIIALLLMAFSCSKITWGFSSRYAAQAIPLLIITGSYFYKPSKINVVRIIVGIAIGIISLISYFIG
jgi:hypothetical protein